MGELIRSIDWSANPLGPVDIWPQSLRTALGILLNSKFPMFLFWGPSLICFYNDAYRPSLGNNGKHPSAMGQRGEDVWPEIWASIKPLIDQVLNEGEATWSEDQLLPIYRNGQLEDVYWTFSYSPVIDESDKPGGVFVTCTETTRKVKAFEQLAESQEQLQLALQASELGTWVLDPLTNSIRLDVRCRELLGFRNDDPVTYTEGLRQIYPDDQESVNQAVIWSLNPKSGGRFDKEFRTFAQNGNTLRWLRSQGKAYFNPQGLAYRFAGTVQDITEQILTRERQENAEQQAKLAVESAEAGTFLIDLTEDTIHYSPTLAKVFTGNEANKLTRNSLVEHIFPDDRPIRANAYRTATQTGKVKYEVRTVWDNGSIHWVRLMGTYLNDMTGKPTRFAGIAQDITAQRMAQQELERQVQERTRELSNANQELLRTNHELEQFAYIASHDLQEPLRKIQSFTDLLQANRQDDELFTNYINKIIKSAQRMSALIKAVLNYSRLAKRDEHIEPIDLNQLLQYVLSDFELLIEEKGATIHTTTLPIIDGIPLQITQLFTNLISNALKFSTANPIIDIQAKVLLPDEVDKHFNLAVAPSYVHLTVSDNGIGFEQQYADHIFTIFQRLNNGKEYTGTGIGLALCRKIVSNHGGIIMAQSEPGQGATFHIYLPVSRSSGQAGTV